MVDLVSKEFFALFGRNCLQASFLQLLVLIHLPFQETFVGFFQSFRMKNWSSFPSTLSRYHAVLVDPKMVKKMIGLNWHFPFEGKKGWIFACCLWNFLVGGWESDMWPRVNMYVWIRMETLAGTYVCWRKCHSLALQEVVRVAAPSS